MVAVHYRCIKSRVLEQKIYIETTIIEVSLSCLHSKLQQVIE